MIHTKLPLWTIFVPDQCSVLTAPAQDVDVATLSDAAFQQLIDDMVVTMRQAKGIGLAAPQVGRKIRLAVISDEVDGQLLQPLVLINPRLTKLSPEQESGEEGCLSIPGVYGQVRRSRHLTLQAFDRHGRFYTLNASHLLARVIQHEADHLAGVLFIDRAEAITAGRERLP